MPVEPSTKRTVAFFDGQNLYHAAKEAFGSGLLSMSSGSRMREPMMSG